MIAALALTVAAMVMIALATRREPVPRPALRRAMRVASVALFAASLAAAVDDLGVGVGIIAWLMALSVGALAAVALLTLRRPQR